MIEAMPTLRKILIPILVMLTLTTFQLANVYVAGGVGDRTQINRCAQRVAPIITQLDKLRAQLVKAGRTLGSALVDPLIGLLDDAGKTLDKASARQIGCSELRPAVDALNQFNSRVKSSQNTIDSQLGNRTTQSWLSKSDKIVKQILLICPCK